MGRAVAPARSNRNGGGYGSRPSPGRRIVYDALARHKIPQIQFSNSLTTSLRAKRSNPWRDKEVRKRVDCFAALAMTLRHNCAISPAHALRVLPKFPALSIEGAGNAGRPMRPIAACAMGSKKRTRVIQVTPESPGIPHAMVYGLSRARPGVPGLLATVIPEKLASHELDTSVGVPGPHDFSVRLKRRSLSAHPRPSHPASRP